jgi:integrase
MYLIKPTGRKKKFDIKFRNWNGRLAKVPGDRDESVANVIGQRIERLVRSKANGDPPPSDLKDWIDGMPENLALRLVELGLLDQRRREQGRSVHDQIDEYVKVVAARKNNTALHAKSQGLRVHRVFREIGLDTFASVTSDAVLVKLNEWGVSVSTRRHYIVAVKDFAKWMFRSGRARENQFADMPVPGMYENPVVERMPLAVPEFQKLMKYLDGFEKYPHQLSRWTASDRKLLYWTAAKTAFRKTELATLTVANLRLEATPPQISIKARNAKNRMSGDVPIPSSLATALKRYVKGKELTDKLFPFPSSANTVVDTFRRDLTEAGVPWELGGEIRDFHTLRTTAITWWLDEDRLSPKRVQVLARLKTLAMVDKYSRNFRIQDFEWLERGPTLVQDKSRVRKT